jgi:hypothetical protein
MGMSLTADGFAEVQGKIEDLLQRTRRLERAEHATLKT